MDRETAKKEAFDKFGNLIESYKKQEKQFKDVGMMDLVITMKAHREMVELQLTTLKQFIKIKNKEVL